MRLPDNPSHRKVLDQGSTVWLANACTQHLSLSWLALSIQNLAVEGNAIQAAA